MQWNEMILELIEAGVCRSEIARRVGLKPPSIPDLLLGRQSSLKWEVGDALIQLHRKHCLKKGASAAPLVPNPA